MTRWVALLGCAAAVTLAVSFAMPASFEAEAARAKNKQCMATNTAGKKVSFKCSAAEKCCWDAVLQKGNCVPASGVCL